MVKKKKKYKIGKRRFGLINWVGAWTLYKKEVLRFLNVWIQTIFSPLISSLLFLLVLSLAIGAERGEVLGVPFIIGIQWILLTFITGSFSSYFFSNNKFKAILFGTVLMVLLDVLIEPVAPEMGFWIFENLTAPLKNYFGWFLIGLPVQFVFHYGIDKKELTFSFNLLLIQFLFFGFMNILAL